MNLLLNLLLLFSSCKENCDVPVQIIGTGEIVENALVSQPIITWDMKAKEHIIQTDSQNIYDLSVSFDDGNTFDSIDFSKYTLLGKYASEGCRVSFERNVTKDNLDKKVYFDIIVYQCGACKTYVESMNWVLIPKISNDYTVVFSVKEK